MFAIRYQDGTLGNKRFATYIEGVRHINRFFNDEHADTCDVVEVSE